MAPKKAAATSTPSLELEALFEKELRAQNEDLRKQAALSTFQKLHPSNRVSVEQFLNSLKQSKEIWGVITSMGVQDFCQSVLGTRTASVATKEEKSGRRTRLSESQKNGLKAMISSILGSHKDGLNRNDIAKAVSNEQLATVGVERGELANKLR